MYLVQTGGGGGEDEADFCVRILQQKVTSRPVEN